MVDTRVGVGFLVDLFFIGRVRATFVTDTTAHSGVGPVSNIPGGISTRLLPLIGTTSGRDRVLLGFVVVAA